MFPEKKILKNSLVFDIETASEYAEYKLLSPRKKELWKAKCAFLVSDKSKPISERKAAILYKQKAAIYAEFGKVICISMGYISKKGRSYQLKLKSLVGEEKNILQQFITIIERNYDDPETKYLCGHNIKEFDVPYLCRRMVINQLHIPKIMNIAGKKPWQVTQFLDTLNLWKFGDFKNYTSLNLLSEVLNIDSPKEDIDGSKVGKIYWKENDIHRIAKYCEKDVITVAQILMKFSGSELIKKENISTIPLQ